MSEPVSKPALIVVGGSMGGARALGVILALLPKSFALPVVVVLHRAKESSDALISSIQRSCKLPVMEADDKTPLASGHVYLAPPDYHLLVERGNLSLSVEDPILFARPSIDVLFESAASAYGRGVIAVALTGASADGAAGAARVKEHGGRVLVQDPETAEARTLPESVIAKCEVDARRSLADLARLLLEASDEARA